MYMKMIFLVHWNPMNNAYCDTNRHTVSDRKFKNFQSINIVIDLILMDGSLSSQ